MLVYAHENAEQKREAIIKANGGEFISENSISEEIDPESYDEQTLKRLYGLT